MSQDKEALTVVAYSPGHHLVSCAIYDPSPGHCDCGSTEEPLVKLADAQAMLRKPVAEREADRAAMRRALEAALHVTDCASRNEHGELVLLGSLYNPEHLDAAITHLRQRLGE